ncbi:MAG: hypothetical protein LBB92_00845 [Endomicrobium sp.]|jgi:predicted HicB family RNase H-like nuclease|nr:hypothetical protein [Endomicrobium sp.]
MSKTDFAENTRNEISHKVLDGFIGNTTETIGNKKEIRNKRVYLSLRPSLFFALQKEADNNDVSINQMINQILRKYNKKK